MAESGEGGSWWGGWLQTAKEKSAMALEFMKKDLTEFSEVMQRDTNTVATSVKDKLTKEQATAATKKVKEGMTNFLGGISKALVIPPDDDYQPLVKTANGMEPIYDRAKARLLAIQMDPETYLKEPQGSKEAYEEWLQDFIIEDRKGDISELLVANAEVPSQVSHSNFWQRYFYRVYQLEQDKKRRAELMKRADDVAGQQLEWDDMEEWDDIAATSPPKSDMAERMNAAGISGNKTAAESISAEATPSVQAEATSEVDGEATATAAGEATTTASERLQSSDSQIITETALPTIPTIKPKEASSGVSECGTTEPRIDVSSGTSSPEMLPSPSQPSDPIKVKDKGDMVIVATDRNTPSSDSTNKESSSLDDDWEKEFDLEVTEEDLKLAQEAAKMLKEKGVIKDGDEDEENEWENWD